MSPCEPGLQNCIAKIVPIQIFGLSRWEQMARCGVHGALASLSHMGVAQTTIHRRRIVLVHDRKEKKVIYQCTRVSNREHVH